MGAQSLSSSDSSDSSQISQSPPPSLSRSPHPRDRPQHGVESLWWVKLYLLAYRVDYPAGDEFPDLVFMNTSLPSVTRRQLFEYPGQVQRDLESYLHPGLQHHSIPGLMQKIRNILYASYLGKEADGHKYMGKLYCRVFRSLDKLVNIIKTEVEGVEFHSIDFVKVPRKREIGEASSKPQDDDEYLEEEEEQSSDSPVPKKSKKARRSNLI